MEYVLEKIKFLAFSFFVFSTYLAVGLAQQKECKEYYSGSSISEERIYVLAGQIRKFYLENGNRRIPVFLTKADITKLKQNLAPDLPMDALYFALIGIAQEYSINFSDKVGAVAVASSGNVYFGFNVEFPGLDVSSFIHAEQVAVANARIPRQGIPKENEIKALYISAAPCGSCRQMLLNTNGDINVLKINFPYHGQIVSETLPKLIYRPFGDTDLNLFDIRDITFSGLKTQRILRSGFPSENKQDLVTLTPLQSAAVTAARRSYTNKDIESYRGSAIEFTSEAGRKEIFSGSYLEATGANHSIRAITQIIVGMREAGYYNLSKRNEPIRNGFGEKIVDAKVVIVQGDDYPFSDINEYVKLVQQVAGTSTNRVQLLTYQTYQEHNDAKEGK